MPRASSRSSARASSAWCSVWASRPAASSGELVHHLAGQAEADPQRDELLLRAVVKVALQATAGLVGGGDQPLPRGAQVLDQPGVAQHQAGLPGHGLDQPLTGRGQRFPQRRCDPQRAEPLALMFHLKIRGHGRSASYPPPALPRTAMRPVTRRP